MHEDQAADGPAARLQSRTGKPFLVWLPEDLHTALKAQAACHVRTLHSLVIRALGPYTDSLRRHRG